MVEMLGFFGATAVFPRNLLSWVPLNAPLNLDPECFCHNKKNNKDFLYRIQVILMFFFLSISHQGPVS